VTVLGTATDELWCALAGAVGLDVNRLDLIEGYRTQVRPSSGSCFAELAALLHRLSPGVRLM
jgi:hypothetical protein